MDDALPDIEIQAAFRAANSEIEQKRRELGIEHRVPYLCECEAQECTALVPLEPAEYDAVRADPNQFLVAPGHGRPERVIDERDRFAVVRLEGAANAASRRAPRRDE